MYGRMNLIDLSFSGHVRIDLFFDLLIPHIGLLIPQIGLLIPHIGLFIFFLMFLKIVKLMWLDMCSVETHFGFIFCLRLAGRLNILVDVLPLMLQLRYQQRSVHIRHGLALTISTIISVALETAIHFLSVFGTLRAL
jgi:hypothetical protein